MCGQPQDSAHPVLVLIFQEDIPTTHSPPTMPYIRGSRPVKQEMRTSQGPPCAKKHVRYFPTESPHLCSQWPCEMGRFIPVLQWEYRAHCASECQRRLRRQGWQSQDPVPLAAVRPLGLLPGALKLLSRRVSTVCVQAVGEARPRGRPPRFGDCCQMSLAEAGTQAGEPASRQAADSSGGPQGGDGAQVSFPGSPRFDLFGSFCEQGHFLESCHSGA